MAAKNTVTLTFAGDKKQLEKTFNEIGDSSSRLTRRVGNASDGFRRSTEGMGAALLKVGAVAGVAAVAVGAAAVKFGTELFTLSRSMVDLDRKSGAVFEDQLPAITAWAEANRKAFGTSTRNVIGMAANLADLLKPMGFTAKQAADMSTKLLGLSGALAKWSGGTRTASEVSEILTSALLGERDALKGLGISISQADVDARLALKGQQDLTGAALAQAQALATQELIFEKSTDAQKAWTDGGKAAAEQQGALTSAVDTLKERLATALTPAFEKATSVVAGWADRALTAFGDVGGTVESFNSEELANLRDALQSVADKIGGAFAESFAALKKWVETNRVEIEKFTNQIASFTRDTGPIFEFLIKSIALQMMTSARAVMILVDALWRLTAWYNANKGWLNLFTGPLVQLFSGTGSQPTPTVSGVPKFHSGVDSVPGVPGSEMLAVLQAGERVTPAAASAGPTVLELRSSGSRVDDLLVEILSGAISGRGGNVQVVLGR